MSTQPIEISPENLRMQIEGFTNFDKTLAGASGIKSFMAEAKAKSRDLYQVDPRLIMVLPGFNPRVQNRAFHEGVEVLAENMKEHGYYQDKPLACYFAKIDGKDALVLHDGHRRHAAVLKAIEMGAPIKTVPVVLKEKSENMIDLTLALLHSNEGQPFTTYEKAVLAKRLKKFGWENKQIAAEFRCTPAFVGQLLQIAGAPQAITELIQNGNMSSTEAHRLMLEHGIEEAERIATEGAARAKSEGRTKITAKDLTPSERKDKNAKKFGPQLYRAVLKLLKNEKVIKAMTNEEHETIDGVLSEIEKKPKVKAEPKPKKATVKKTPAAKKVPIAKKIAAAAKKGGEIKTKEKSGEGFWERANQEEAERKASKQAAAAPSASRRAVAQRRSDR